MASTATLRDLGRRLVDGPVEFARVVLGHDLWRMQARILEALNRPHARVAVKACHASSKSFTAAEAVLWWTARGGVCVTTAPTWTQVEDVLWREVRQAYQQARLPLGGDLLQTELRIGRGHALGLSTNEGVRFQGFHGDVLIVFDEAPGVRPDIIEAAQGIAAGGDVRMLFLGNPTVASGPFYDLFQSAQSGLSTFTIDALDTPNLAGLTLEGLLRLPGHELDANVRPYLVTRRWVRDRYDEWGEDAAEWQARVRGEFPQEAEDALISRAWLNEAAGRAGRAGDGDAFHAGLDVAGPGEDESALWLRRGSIPIGCASWHEADTDRLIGNVLHELRPVRDHLLELIVDATGIGYHLAGVLRRDFGERVIGVNAGAAPVDKGHFRRRKDELYWGLRERYRQGLITGKVDAITAAQLTSLRYHHTPAGQVEVESKDELRKRGVKSPDRAEALMLAFARPDAATLAPRSRSHAFHMVP